MRHPHAIIPNSGTMSYNEEEIPISQFLSGEGERTGPYVQYHDFSVRDSMYVIAVVISLK